MVRLAAFACAPALLVDCSLVLGPIHCRWSDERHTGEDARGLAGRSNRRELHTQGLSPPQPVAVALGKAWFGGLLVLFFGIGMAVTLAAAGLLAHDLVGRLERVVARSGRMSSSVRRVVAYGAATGVCLIRLGVVLRTIVSLA